MTAPVANWVLLARIVRPQGRHGEVLAEIFTDFPESFSQRGQLFLRDPRAGENALLRPTAASSQWLHKGRVVLKLSEVDSINAAELLRGFEIVVPEAERIPLTGDAVYVSDLVGMTLVDVNSGRNEAAGEIIDVEPEGVTAAMLVVRTKAGDESLVPFVRAYLKKVDLPAKRLEMELPEGLLALQAPAQTEGSDQLSPAEDPKNMGSK